MTTSNHNRSETGVVFRCYGIAADGEWYRIDQCRDAAHARRIVGHWRNAESHIVAGVVERVPFGPAYGGEGWPSRIWTEGDAEALRRGNWISHAAYQRSRSAPGGRRHIAESGAACLIESTGAEVNR